MMILLVGFLVACASLFLTKKYWAAFFLGWGIFLVIYLAFLEKPDRSNDSITTKIFVAFFMYLMPFVISGVVWGVIKKKKTVKNDKEKA